MANWPIKLFKSKPGFEFIAKKHDTKHYNAVLVVVHEKSLPVVIFFVLPDSSGAQSAHGQSPSPFK